MPEKHRQVLHFLPPNVTKLKFLMGSQNISSLKFVATSNFKQKLVMLLRFELLNWIFMCRMFREMCKKQIKCHYNQNKSIFMWDKVIINQSIQSTFDQSSMPLHNVTSCLHVSKRVNKRTFISLTNQKSHKQS
jgi:hypothetical protein